MSAKRTAGSSPARADRMVRVTLAQALKRRGRTDWPRVLAMTDAELERKIAADPDAGPLLPLSDWLAADRIMPGHWPPARRRGA